MQQRRQERKNRDEFRKLMEDHVATGVLTAKTRWHDYCMQVFFPPQFMCFELEKLMFFLIYKLFFRWGGGSSKGSERTLKIIRVFFL